MANQEYYVAMTIKGEVVESSAIISGLKTRCDQVCARMNKSKTKHPTVGFVVIPCAKSPYSE